MPILLSLLTLLCLFSDQVKASYTADIEKMFAVYALEKTTPKAFCQTTLNTLPPTTFSEDGTVKGSSLWGEYSKTTEFRGIITSAGQGLSFYSTAKGKVVSPSIPLEGRRDDFEELIKGEKNSLSEDEIQKRKAKFNADTLKAAIWDFVAFPFIIFNHEFFKEYDLGQKVYFVNFCFDAIDEQMEFANKYIPQETANIIKELRNNAFRNALEEELQKLEE